MGKQTIALLGDHLGDAISDLVRHEFHLGGDRGRRSEEIDTARSGDLHGICWMGSNMDVDFYVDFISFYAVRLTPKIENPLTS